MIEELRGNTALIRRVDQLAGQAFRSNVDKLSRVAGQYPGNVVWDGASKIQIPGRSDPDENQATIAILKQQNGSSGKEVPDEECVGMEDFLPEADY